MHAAGRPRLRDRLHVEQRGPRAAEPAYLSEVGLHHGHTPGGVDTRGRLQHGPCGAGELRGCRQDERGHRARHEQRHMHEARRRAEHAGLLHRFARPGVGKAQGTLDGRLQHGAAPSSEAGVVRAPQ
eukprot:8867710-Pyramimonas_sp.AAC.1